MRATIGMGQSEIIVPPTPAVTISTRMFRLELIVCNCQLYQWRFIVRNQIVLEILDEFRHKVLGRRDKPRCVKWRRSNVYQAVAQHAGTHLIRWGRSH